MASISARIIMAAKAAYSAFRDAGTDPSVLVNDFTERRQTLNHPWALYENSKFQDINAWAPYRTNNVLYRNIRSIYNPTRRLVNFYVSQVYPGVLSMDANSLPDGVQLAIPLSRDTDEKLGQWSNWQSGNKLMVRYGAATGSCLVEIVDDVVKGKVAAQVRWPGLISDLELDGQGNVKFYALEYDVTEDAGPGEAQLPKTYTYRKEVTGETFKYFRDNEPFIPEGHAEAVEENPYGFVPAVWCKHLDEGSDFGAAAISGSIAKIDELNGTASHAFDLIDKQIEAPGIIASTSNVSRLEAQSDARKAKLGDEYMDVSSTREKNSSMLILKGGADTTWHPMVSNLAPSEIIPHMEKLLTEIEHDFPELSMFQTLRDMSTVTGPGASRLMGDVYGKVLEVSSNYDQQSIKLFAMAAAIGGFRYKEGREGWRAKTKQQAKFAPFDLNSYAKGDLDFSIDPRPLIAPTVADSLDIQTKRFANAAAAPNVDDDTRWEIAGFDEEKRGKLAVATKAKPADTVQLVGATQ